MSADIDTVWNALTVYFEKWPHEAPTTAEFSEWVRQGGSLLDRSCLPMHITASAWVVDPIRDVALVVFHRKLAKWIQPGGHADGDADLAGVALREAREETGIASLRLASAEVFDVGITPIAASSNSPEHCHLDVRFRFVADSREDVAESAETAGAMWVDFGQLEAFGCDAEILRMAAKMKSA